MRFYRANKRPPEKKTIIIINQPPAQPQPAQQPQAIKPRKQKPNLPKAPQQLQRVPQQVIKMYIPLYKSPNGRLMQRHYLTIQSLHI
jgi:hypothetical protein